VVDARQNLDVSVRMVQASKDLGIDAGRHLPIGRAISPEHRLPDGCQHGGTCELALKAAQTPCWSTVTAGPDTRMAKAAGAW
jgi:hypothetical protein